MPDRSGLQSGKVRGGVMAHFYDHPAGVEAPSVTTVLETVSTESLWRWKQKKILEYIRDEGINMRDRGAVPHMITHIENLAEEEAAIGTWLHSLAENILKGSNAIPECPEILQHRQVTLELLQSRLLTYLKSIGNYRVIGSEIIIHGQMELDEGIGYFSGTADALLGLGARKKINCLDFKTSFGTYDHHVAQVCAYGYGWNTHTVRMTPKLPRVEGLCIVRINKGTKSEPYHTEFVRAKAARMGLSLFKSALNTWYLRSGLWGRILSE